VAFADRPRIGKRACSFFPRSLWCSVGFMYYPLWVYGVGTLVAILMARIRFELFSIWSVRNGFPDLYDDCFPFSLSALQLRIINNHG